MQSIIDLILKNKNKELIDIQLVIDIINPINYVSEIEVVGASTPSILNIVGDVIAIEYNGQLFEGNPTPIQVFDGNCLLKIYGKNFSFCDSTCDFKNLKLDSKIVSTIGMFSGCSKLTSMNIPTHTINGCRMFLNCSSMKTIIGALPLSLKNASQMFSGCISLKECPELPLGLLECSEMFFNCTQLSKAKDIPNSVLNCSSMFNRCTSLIEPPNIGINVINTTEMFAYCSSLRKSPSIPLKVKYCSKMFLHCKELQAITSTPKGMISYDGCYAGCKSINKPIKYNDIPTQWKTEL